MRKKIAVHIGEIAGSFQQTIMRVITEKANALGYDVVAICSYGSYNDDILFAEGEKASVYLPDHSQFAGVIVTEDLFDVPGMGDELYAKLKRDARCPVVYLRHHRDGFYNILVENTVSMEQMVRHFLDDHGFTDVCYMSGKPESFDSQERLRGFRNVMEEKGIPITEHMIFHGDFWREKGREAMEWFMEGRETYPQAIICANDYMAISICDELRARGVRVPEDVCVSGFDFALEAKAYEPTLTSLEVDFESMSARAVDIIDNVNHGIKEEPVQRMPAKVMLNKSCGCGDQYNLGNAAAFIKENYRSTAYMKDIMLLNMEYQDSVELDEFMDSAEKYKYMVQAERTFFCFLDHTEEGVTDVENISSFTEQMILYRIFEHYKKPIACRTKFPRSKILPDEYWEDDASPKNYYVFTIHFKNTVYGYLVAEEPTERWFDIFTQAYLLNLATAIATSTVQRRMAKLEEIRALYQKDELTGIYNRRGFDRLLREKFTAAKETRENIAVVSIDMDNLKVINDSYGHTAGDEALKGMAAALDSVMEEGEFCARVGGDEFAAALVVNRPERADDFRKNLKEAMKRQSENLDQFEVMASVGICELAEDFDASLIACVQKADMRMYEEKRARKKAK